jgi:hypothetical protein
VSDACARPLQPETLLDYWLDGPSRGAGDDAASGGASDGASEPTRALAAELEAIEEHLFACASCSRRLQQLVALGSGIRRLVHDGAVELVATPALLARAVQQGLRVREYRLAPGERVSCTVTPDDDLLVSRLVGRFEGVSRLDLLAEQDGVVRRVEDVPVSPEAGELIVAQAMPAMRRLGHARLRVRLVSQEEAGERLVGEYTFEHHPTRAGQPIE